MAVFYIDNQAQKGLTMTRGNIYRFDQNNNSNSSSPLLLSTTEDGENAGGSRYATGVSYWLNNIERTAAQYVGDFSSATSRFMQIQVDATAPATLYYYAVGNPGMGGEITISG